MLYLISGYHLTEELYMFKERKKNVKEKEKIPIFQSHLL